jgi:hypothetical protein
MVKYVYEPLSDSSQNCRFLIIQPEKLTDTAWGEDVARIMQTPHGLDTKAEEEQGVLQGFMIEVPLRVAESRGFYALSYCWGPDRRCSEILLNHNQRLGITQNLETAIRHLTVPIIWIDQICINQENSREKSAQIPLMSRIYSEATAAILWLGLESNDSSLAIEYMQRIQQALQKQLTNRTPIDPAATKTIARYEIELARLTNKEVTATSWKQVDIEDITLLARSEIQQGHLTAKEITAMLEFFQRPWFKRVWTIQELLLAKNPVFLLGKQYVPVYFTVTTATVLHRVFSTKSTGIISTSGAEHLVPPSQGKDSIFFQYLRQFFMASLKPLHMLLVDINFGRHTPHASDPRDRIYGILSLASDIQQLNIIPDYTKPCEHAFQTTAKKIIIHGAVVDYLAFVNSRAQVPQLPSWAYDPRVVNQVLPGFLSDSCPFSASGNKKQPKYDGSEAQEGLLTLQGIGVDRILEIENFSVFEGETMCFIETMLLVAKVALLYSKAQNKLEQLYKTAERAMEAIWRTPLEDFYCRLGEFTKRTDRTAYTGWKQISKRIEQVAIQMGTATAEDAHNDRHLEPLEAAHDTDAKDSEPPEGLSASTQSDDLLESGQLDHPACSMIPFDVELIEKFISICNQEAPRTLWLLTHLLCLTLTAEELEWVNTVAKSKCRRPFVSERGYIGMAPARAQPGDLVVVFYGGKLPYVIRAAAENPNHFELIGGCYCDGIMDGELFQESNELEERAFILE